MTDEVVNNGSIKLLNMCKALEYNQIMPYYDNLYHFTDERNISSIKEKGLLSAAKLFAKYNMKFDVDFFPASNRESRHWDTKLKLNNYIRLSGHMDHPMAKKAVEEKRIEKIAWIELDFDIIFDRRYEKKYSDLNANSKEALINSDFKTFTSSHYTQSEVMVRGEIPITLLRFL